MSVDNGKRRERRSVNTLGASAVGRGMLPETTLGTQGAPEFASEEGTGGALTEPTVPTSTGLIRFIWITDVCSFIASLTAIALAVFAVVLAWPLIMSDAMREAMEALASTVRNSSSQQPDDHSRSTTNYGSVDGKSEATPEVSRPAGGGQ
jgi:hypothetical protein